MSELAGALVVQLIRTTVVLGVAAFVLPWVLKAVRCRSPVVYRVGLCLVLLEGWTFVGVPVATPFVVSGFWQAREPAEMVAPEHDATHVGQSRERENTAGMRTRPAAAAVDAVEAEFGQAGVTPRAGDPLKLTGGKGHIDRLKPVTRSGSGIFEFGVWLAGVWAAGVACVAGWWAAAYARFVRRLPPLETTPVDAEWLAEWDSVRGEAGARQAITLQTLPGLGPMLCRLPGGYRLIVPSEVWPELSREQRLGILRHELAHLVRGDVWKSLAARVLALPHWFNPLAWRTVRLFDECAEWACDEAARRAAPAQAGEYARALLCLGAGDSQSPILTPAARGSGLGVRIRRLLGCDLQQEDSKMKKTFALVVVTGLAACGLVRFQVAADESAAGVASVTEDRRAAAPEADEDDTVGVTIRPSGEEAAPLAAAAESKQSDLLSEIDVRLDATSVTSDSAVPVEQEASRARSRRTAAGRELGGREAVIDISHLFKNLEGFERARDELRAEVEHAQKRAYVARQRIFELQQRLEGLDGDAADYRLTRELLESELARRKAELAEDSTTSQKRFLKEEADLYYRVYSQITAEVRRYAREHGIREVRRADSHRRREVDPDDPKAIMQLLNREVIFTADEPLDITREILERLNARSTPASSEAREGARRR